jgi:adenine-specific DNA-methyltransferase
MSDIKKITAADPESHSNDQVAQNLDQLKSVFPEAFTEGKVNFDVLKQLLGGAIDDREEKYGLNWHGKRRARQLALTPSAGTLRPCPEESLDWDATQNLMIEGDNLEVLKLLQKSYAGRIKVIYIDPPYNTGKDFVYPDDFRDNIRNYLELTGQIEGGRAISSNADASGRFHTDWLNMIYPRLRLARNLLRQDGAIFISIDDAELGNLRVVCNEVFGEECFGGCVARVTGTPTGGGNRALVNEIDYVLVYFRTPDVAIEGVPFTEEDAEIYDKEDKNGRYLIRSLRRTGGEDRREDRPSMFYPLSAPDGTKVYPIAPAGYESRWICGLEKYRELERDGLIEWVPVKKDGKGKTWQVYQKFYLEGRLKQPSNLWSELEGNKKATRDLRALFGGEKVFDFPKPVGLIRHIVQLAAAAPDSIVMDFFAGSGTTAHAVMAQNAQDNGARRYVLVQLPEPLNPGDKSQTAGAKFCDKLKAPRNIATLTKERLRRAAKLIKSENRKYKGDLGFRVLKLDSTNIQEWATKPQDIQASLQSSMEHLKPERREEDILHELLLKLGLDLCVPIEKRAIAKKNVHAIGGGVLMACLAEKIASKEVEGLALAIIEWHKALAPAGEVTCVFRDSAFEDDVAKTNMAAILEQHGLKNVRSL